MAADDGLRRYHLMDKATHKAITEWIVANL